MARESWTFVNSKVTISQNITLYKFTIYYIYFIVILQLNNSYMMHPFMMTYIFVIAPQNARFIPVPLSKLSRIIKEVPI